MSFGVLGWSYWSDLFLCLPGQTERSLDGVYFYNCENLRAGLMAWQPHLGSPQPQEPISAQSWTPRPFLCYFCSCHWCLLLLTWAVNFTLTLSLWSCSWVTDLPLTLVILPRAKLHIEFWAWPRAGPITMSLSHDLGSQMALPVLPWPAQRCLQAKLQDRSYN